MISIRHVVVSIPTFLALVSCSRPQQGPWMAEGCELSLGRGLDFFPPETGRTVLGRVLEDGTETEYDLAIEHSVRQRGRGMPTMKSSVRDTMVLNLRTSTRGEGRGDVIVTVSDPSVAVDPDVEGLEGEMVEAFDSAMFHLGIDRSGRVTVENDGGSSRGNDPYARELMEHLRRLSPLLPDHAVGMGEQWEMPPVEMARALPGGFPGRVVLAGGSYRFLGMVGDSDRSLAAIDLNYRVTMDGGGMTVDIAGLLSGAGNGRGFYLVDADTGAVVSAQVSESVHGEVRLTRKDKVQRVEQLATVVVSLDERE